MEIAINVRTAWDPCCDDPECNRTVLPERPAYDVTVNGHTVTYYYGNKAIDAMIAAGMSPDEAVNQKVTADRAWMRNKGGRA